MLISNSGGSVFTCMFLNQLVKICCFLVHPFRIPCMTGKRYNRCKCFVFPATLAEVDSEELEQTHNFTREPGVFEGTMIAMKTRKTISASVFYTRQTNNRTYARGVKGCNSRGCLSR